MTWEDISHLNGKKFRRATGVYRSVFEDMVNCFTEHKKSKRKTAKSGLTSKLSLENQVLMTVLYWREYRSQENLGLDFHLTQSRVSRIIYDVEYALIQSGSFSLPGKKVLKDANAQYEVVIVDVTETPTERPKKNKNANTVGKRNDTL